MTKVVFRITKIFLSGSNITMDASGAGIYMSNKGPGSDQTNTGMLKDEYYIDFTPDGTDGKYVKIMMTWIGLNSIFFGSMIDLYPMIIMIATTNCL